MITIPSTTGDVGAQLSRQFATQKKNNQLALIQIMSSIQFLCRQGLPLRGDGDESDGNLQQVLRMKALKDPNLTEWLKRRENVYTSPDIQNEIIKLMGLRDMAAQFQSSPFHTIMADETTDASNIEQVTLFIRWVTDDLQVHEDFVGLYSVPSIAADMLVSVIKDVFMRMNLRFDKVRGQCYDGASAMSGKRRGVAKQISDIEPRAVFTHCYGHALNLAASDTIKSLKVMKDALETTHEITKLIKFSPRREAIFQVVKQDMPGTSSGIRVLCPTRWTVKADALASIMSNFEALQITWEEAVDVVSDTEVKARIRGVSAVMSTFDYLYGNVLGEMLLKHADNLSSTLQHKTISAAEGQQVAQMTVQTLRSLRNEASFDLFWLKVNKIASDFGVGEPQLPRRRRVPRRYDDGQSEGDFHAEAKSLYRQQYFEAIDLIVTCIEYRFNQPGYKTYQSLQSLLLKACRLEECESDLQTVCQFYKDDFDQNLLRTQLQTLGLHFQQVQGQPAGSTNTKFNIFDVKNYFLSLSPGQLSLLSNVKRLMQLILVMPATNASSERSFSALRCVKTYLRATMKQERLNYMMLLHIHKDKTDAINLKSLVNEFVGCSDHRTNIFSKF